MPEPGPLPDPPSLTEGRSEDGSAQLGTVADTAGGNVAAVLAYVTELAARIADLEARLFAAGIPYTP